MSATTAMIFKRLGEAAHGLEGLLDPGGVGTILIDPNDPTNIDYSLGEIDAGIVEPGGDRAGWALWRFRAGPTAVPPTIPFSVTVTDMDSGVSKAYRAGKPQSSGAPAIDAIFFTTSAIEKFVAPYLTALYGPKIAKQRLEELRAAGDGAFHDPGTVFRNLSEPGLLPEFKSLRQDLEE